MPCKITGLGRCEEQPTWSPVVTVRKHGPVPPSNSTEGKRKRNHLVIHGPCCALLGVTCHVTMGPFGEEVR